MYCHHRPVPLSNAEGDVGRPRAITDSALASVRRRVAASTADGPLDELDDAQIHMWDAAQAAHDRAAYGQHEERLIECTAPSRETAGTTQDKDT